ncbi:MAG: flagellar hook-associated protein FlgL [Gemmatimonadetes bacterium]|nr:flagellar hook-associated protein FlgL [Gemmatimonadota bacterium]
MRITNNMATRLAVTQFDVSRSKLEDAQRKVTTGKAFSAASEDPTAALSVMANTGALRALDQYKRNIGAGNRRLALEETAVSQLSSILERAKELGMAMATDTMSATNRQAGKAEVNQLMLQAAALGNTQDGNEYLFGGTKTDTPPLAIDTTGSVYTFTASGGTGARQVDVSAGQRASTAHDGTQVFGTAAAGVMKSLQDLATALAVGTSAAVAGALPGIDTAMTTTLGNLGEIGARQNQMQMADANITAFSQNLVALNSDLQDVDLETAMVELVSRQTAYQAAMSATSRIMNLNLTDYLR